MMPLRISFVLILLLSFSNLSANVPGTKTLTLTTFNIRFYGLHGQGEKRDPFLQNFLKESIPASDIIVFEEIVDVPRVKSILPEGWDCLSYDTPFEGHQHVVLCHSPDYRFMREPTDNNDLIDEVAGEKGRLRPALTTIVTDLAGNKLVRVVAVHLKASPAYSKLRIAQSAMIANYLEKLQNSKLPVIIAGDFNTYSAPANNETVDDVELITNTLNNANLGIHRIANDLFTFRNSYGQGKFDQFYVSDSIKAVRPLQIFEICNAELSGDEGALDLALYNQNISDHCPVSAEISL